MPINNELRELAKQETLTSFLEYAKVNQICFYYHYAEFNPNALEQCVFHAGHACPAILHQSIGKCNQGLGNHVKRKNIPKKNYRRLEETLKNKNKKICSHAEFVENSQTSNKKNEDLIDLDQARRLVKKVIARNKK